MRTGELTSVELTGYYLARAERLTATYGAFITLTGDRAIAEAERADAVLRERPSSCGPLHGVPTAVKDLSCVAGVRCSYGSAVFADFVPDHDDDLVVRLRQSGMPLLGKTHVPEFGLPAYTESDLAPPARTPWDLTRSAGGSSGGAAAAVAAGLLPLAVGSDGGGSIRIPASVCGLVGLKTSRGLVQDGPEVAGPGVLGVHGPIARTTSDAAALLDVLVGAFAAPGRRTDDGFLAASRRPPNALRIGRCATPLMVDTDVDRECLNAFDVATDVLMSLGHLVEDVPPMFTPSAAMLFETIWGALAAGAVVATADEVRLRPLTQWLRRQGRELTSSDVDSAVDRLGALSAKAVESMAGFDAVLTPTLAQPPVLVGQLRNDENPAADFEAQMRFTPYTAPFNVSGQPAITLPVHVGDGGLPIGVQLVGRPGDDALLLSLAAQIEAIAPWSDRLPRVD